MGGQVWEVVGGEDKGGILVRESKDLASSFLKDRLSCGALIEELELEAERLKYKKLTGTGPDSGWVSIRLKEKILVQKTSKVPEAKKPKFDPYAILGIAPDATDAVIKSAFRKASVRCHPDRNPDDPNAAENFRELTRAKDFLLNPMKRLLYNSQNKLLKPTVNEVWWSDWDEIFDEIDPTVDYHDYDEEGQRIGPAPAVPLTDGRVDVLIAGATGMTGTMACMVMQRQHSKLTWMIAGRDGRKLERLADKFGQGTSFGGFVRAETTEDYEALARRARVVVDFRGPMYQCGTILGEACVRAGTHYLVNSGDVLFNKPFRDKVQAEAVAKGVCVSSGVGMLSSLADFGAWYVVKYVREQFGLPTRRIDQYPHSIGQMFSGSMIATGLARDQKQVDQDMEAGGGPFFLGGVRPCGAREEDEDKAEPTQDPYSGMWAMPIRVPDAHYVRCSCGLFDASQPWGDAFLYKNWTLFPDRQAADHSLFLEEWAKRTYKRSIEQKKIPPPGYGPNERLRQESFLTVVLVAEAEEKVDARKVYCIIRAGPGGMADRFEGSATIALESAVCLLEAQDAGLKLRTGWGTPTWHLAHLGFFERLVAKGFNFKVVDGVPKPSFFKNLINSTLPLGDEAE